MSTETEEPTAVIGLGSVLDFHKNNTGGALNYFKIKDGQSVIMRVLACNNESETLPQIQSIYMHKKYNVIKDTRCAWNGSEPNPSKCALCAVKCTRTMNTYLPIRVRGDSDTSRVQLWSVGRELVQQLASVIEEMPEQDITQQDLKVKRIGEKLDTKYTILPVDNTRRELDKDERALIVPDINTLIPIKTEDELAKIAMDYSRAVDAKPTGASEPEEEKPPF